MKSRTSFTAMALFTVLATTLILAASALAQDSETVVYTFPGGGHGAVGGTQFVSDSAGNLYGTTISGGNKGWGAIVGFADRTAEKRRYAKH